MREVAQRLQTEMQDLQWEAEDRFIIVDKELTVSQTIAGHNRVRAKLVDWGLHPIKLPYRHAPLKDRDPGSLPQPNGIRFIPSNPPRSNRLLRPDSSSVQPGTISPSMAGD